MSTHAWFDVSAGVAGDMVLGALLDAGADLAQIQQAIDALVPGSVQLSTSTVIRGGQRGTKLHVDVLVEDPPHRSWASIRELISASALAPRTRELVLATFARLAAAEGRVHGIDADQVHFHEVGALDSIADVVGVCEAVRLLDIDHCSASPLALGAGRIRAAHGDIPVPVPAVAQLVLGWPVFAAPGTRASVDHPVEPAEQDHSDDHGQDHMPGELHHHGDGAWHSHAPAHDRPATVTTPGQVGELATPTGVALVRTLAPTCEPLPEITPSAIGVGAGGKDFVTHPNVVRVVIGQTTPVAPSPIPGTDQLVELQTNVDDFDPRLWPGVLDRLLELGARDAWLSPILMKKGRPGHTLHALATPADQELIGDAVMALTSALGVRAFPTQRRRLERGWVTVPVAGQPCRVKIGHTGALIEHATAEFADLAAIAEVTGCSQYEVAQLATAALVNAGLVAGAPLPNHLAATPERPSPADTIASQADTIASQTGRL